MHARWASRTSTNDGAGLATGSRVVTIRCSPANTSRGRAPVGTSLSRAPYDDAHALLRWENNKVALWELDERLLRGELPLAEYKKLVVQAMSLAVERM